MAWFHQWLSMGSPWQRRYANTLERAAASTTSCLLKEYYHSQVPLASLAMADLPLLVFDLEMTGLDANKDQIVSIGWVGIDKGKIALATAGSCILAIDGHIGQSACIHGIVDSVSQEGISLTSGLEQLITAAHGRLLVAHHAPLDLGFLAHHGKQVWGEPLCLHAIDTLTFEQQRFQLRQQAIGSDDLRLGACRARYHLPIYPAHSAFMDALACAELLLAQLASAKPTQWQHLLVSA